MLISTGVGVGSQRTAYGSDAKKAHIFSEMINPKLPATKTYFAKAGKRGMAKQATIPMIRDQKHIRGSTSKLLRGAIRDNLLK